MRVLCANPGSLMEEKKEPLLGDGRNTDLHVRLLKISFLQDTYDKSKNL